MKVRVGVATVLLLLITALALAQRGGLGRLQHNTDISQFWEWSGRGLRPIDRTNEAYTLGVNAIISGLTH